METSSVAADASLSGWRLLPDDDDILLKESFRLAPPTMAESSLSLLGDRCRDRLPPLPPLLSKSRKTEDLFWAPTDRGLSASDFEADEDALRVADDDLAGLWGGSDDTSLSLSRWSRFGGGVLPPLVPNAESRG